MENIQEIIVKPLITEKSLKEAGLGKYTFIVKKSANKDEIKVAIEKMFDVKVKKIFVNLIKGQKTKITKFGKRKTKYSFKKARVKLEKDQKIDIFEVKEDKDVKKS